MIPADSKDLRNEYDILLNELRKYNPELLDKKRLLAITKSDMLDEELKADLKKEVPEEIPHVFISSVTNQGISELKDLIWRHLH
jgi:GTP-binding protein